MLSRAFYAGSQKYGFIWTGDNKATWDFMKYSVDMIASISLCGYSALGADVGGFADNPSEELMQAWFDLGAFYPFFRGHSHHESIRREPWTFSNETCESMKNAITLRYNLLLYWYTKFYNYSLTGIPIIKPMWLKYHKYYNVYSKLDNNHFVVGDEFIIIPYLNKKQYIHI